MPLLFSCSNHLLPAPPFSERRSPGFVDSLFVCKRFFGPEGGKREFRHTAGWCQACRKGGLLFPRPLPKPVIPSGAGRRFFFRVRSCERVGLRSRGISLRFLSSARCPCANLLSWCRPCRNNRIVCTDRYLHSHHPCATLRKSHLLKYFTRLNNRWSCYHQLR
jgi:hypothetical protein